MAVSKYASYDTRLATLRNWSCHVWHDIRTIARAGLYRLDSAGDDPREMLRCAFCEFLVADWRREDNAWETHAAHAPTCLHLLCCKGLEYVKRILEQEGCDIEALGSIVGENVFSNRFSPQDLTILGISGMLIRRQNNGSASPSSGAGSAGVYRTYRGVAFRCPNDIGMANSADRLETFSVMYELYRQMFDLEALAEAGFYFTGTGDSVRCYYCGEGFTNWKRTDDPWVEHVRYVPHCMHVILTKGEEFVETVLGDVHGQLRRTTPAERRARKRTFGHDREGDIHGQGKKKVMLHGVEEVAERRGTRGSRVTDEDGEVLACATCGRLLAVSAAVCSLCCRVIVCAGCASSDQRCPACRMT